MSRNTFRILYIAFHFICIPKNGVKMKISFRRIFICHKTAFFYYQGGQTRIAAMPMSVRTRPYTQEAHLPVSDFSRFPGCKKLICYTIHIAIRLIGGILMNPVMTTHFIATPPSAIVTLITLFALLLCVLVPRSSLETIDSLKLDTT